MHNYRLLLIVFLPVFGCVPVTQQTTTKSPKIIFDDYSYLNNLGLIQIHPKGQPENSIAVVKANGSNTILSFDLMENEYRSLTLSMKHCNRTWTPSPLISIRFLDIYNEFRPSNYYFSANTLLDYTNYEFDLPAPKVGGNYLLTVKDENTGELILSRKLLVIDTQTTVQSEIGQNSNINRRQNQEIDFSIKYDPRLNIVPLRDFFPIVIQNHIWDSQISGLKPNLIRVDEGYVEFDLFNGENSFPAGNEYRTFDISSLEFRGMNVELINQTPNQIQAFLSPDKPRPNLAYTQVNQDLNGQFKIKNSDLMGTKERNQYIQVFFELVQPKLPSSKVFVFGAFNGFIKNINNQMSYDETSNSYKANLQLKQGRYDYMYVTDDDNPYQSIAGNFFQVENLYEVILYYRSPLNSFDEIIGYSSILSGD
jgi:hypothetical protein